jgi:DNA-binding transcriptional MerR regulator
VEQLLTIGEFAERCGLSRSALRFYDQNGLLEPRLVDSGTGYRYYATGQVEEALLVRRLRRAEVPVGVLREYLGASPQRRRVILEGHSASFRQRLSSVESVIAGLRGDLDREQAGDVDRWCSVAADEFVGALNQVRFAVADPAVRADLGVVWIETKDGSLRLVATDSYRLAVRDVLPESLGASVISGVIDVDQARELGATTAESLVFSQALDGVITALLDGRAVPIGGAGEGFPDYEAMLAGLPGASQLALTRNDLQGALQSIPADVEQLWLSFERDRLFLDAAGDCTEVLASWSGSPLSVLVDMRFFVEAVAATVGPDVLIEAIDALQPITIRSADTGTFSVLTMPIRPPATA